MFKYIVLVVLVQIKVFISYFLLINISYAQPVLSLEQNSPRYLAMIEVNTSQELSVLLNRANHLFESGDFKVGHDDPIVFVLNGAEIKTLLQENYRKNKAIIDLAAKLAAFEIVNIRVCNNWMRSGGFARGQLPPFISTVPSGPAERKRLLSEEKYIYF